MNYNQFTDQIFKILSFMHIGLLFGSFNPIHIGHLIIANSMLDFAKLDEVWLVITPQNPHKINSLLVDKFLRLQMVELAIDDNPKLKASTIEFDMPQPNYTINTLNKLVENYPNFKFSLLIGEDNLTSFDTWKDAKSIKENFKIWVYPRLNQSNLTSQPHPNISVFPCPKIEISSTYIRNNIKNNCSIKYLVTKDVEQFIIMNHLYGK